MKSNRAGVRLFLAIGFLLITGSSWAKTPLPLTFEAGAVVARVSPGAKTAWILIGQEPAGRGTKLIRRHDTLRDEDGDGIVRLALPRPPALSSIWIVVDLASANYAIAGADGERVRVRTLPPSVFVARGKNRSAQLAQRGVVTVFVVARAGVGAWITKIEDGTRADGDAAANGRTTAALNTMAVIGDSPASPADLHRDDLVIFVDPLTLAVHVASVPN